MLHRLKAFVRGHREPQPAAVEPQPSSKKVKHRLTPAVTLHDYPEPERHSPRQHAKQLLKWLAEHEIAGPLRTDEIKDYYVEMIIDLYWHTCHWNLVAKEFTRLTSKKKKYAWVRDERTGKRHKLRIYPLPSPARMRRAA